MPQKEYVFDEKRRRRPEWVEGPWVRLADGQLWSFPVIKPRMVPRIPPPSGGPSGGLRLHPETPLEVVMPLHEMFRLEEDDWKGYWRCLQAAGAALLRLNYDLLEEIGVAGEACEFLLPFNPDGPYLPDAYEKVRRGDKSVFEAMGAIADALANFKKCVGVAEGGPSAYIAADGSSYS